MMDFVEAKEWEETTLCRMLLQRTLLFYLRENAACFAEPLEWIGQEKTDYLPHLVVYHPEEEGYLNYYLLEEEPDAAAVRRMQAFAARNRAKVRLLLLRELPELQDLSAQRPS